MDKKTATLIAQIFGGKVGKDLPGTFATYSVTIPGRDLLGRPCELKLDNIGWTASRGDQDLLATSDLGPEFDD